MAQRQGRVEFLYPDDKQQLTNCVQTIALSRSVKTPEYLNKTCGRFTPQAEFSNKFERCVHNCFSILLTDTLVAVLSL